MIADFVPDATDPTKGTLGGTAITLESYYLTANAMTHDALEALPVTTPYVDVAFGGTYFMGDAEIDLPEGDYMVGSTNPEEFLGAWKLMVDELLELYPNATVVMMTAWEDRNQTREDGLESIPYTTSVIDLYHALYAENSRVALIDSGDPEVSGVYMLDATFRSLYAYDYYHLNDEGMVMMANNMIPYLVEVVDHAATAEAAE